MASWRHWGAGFSPQSARPEECEMEPCRQLFVVDDDHAVAVSVKYLLEIVGWLVTVCTSGPELLSHPELHQSWCVLLDWHMQRMDGLTVLKLLRATPFRGVVIVMSSALTPVIHRQALSAGAVAVVEKPFGDEELIKLLQSNFRL